MHLRTCLVAPCLISLALLSQPCALSAQSTDIPGTPQFSIGDACQMVGGAVALGFGIWHFAVPSLYRWWSYVPDAPQTLVEAVDATNFFFSFSLSLIGAANIVTPLLADETAPVSRYWLWTNVALWTGRVVYQLVRPQGSQTPALQWGMLAAFMVTDALFVFSALDATL